MALVWWLLLFHFVGASFEAPRGFAPLGVEHGGGRSVLVTGAGGRTGALLLEALCGQSEFTAVYGMVRSSQKAATLQQRLATVAEKAVQPQIVVGDVRHPQTLVPLMKGLDALVILTSSSPRLTQWSAWKAKVKRWLGFKKVRRTYYFPKHESPQEIDWLGQKEQIDAAKEAGVRHIVLVGSMAGTVPNHLLNTLGKGNVLRWKRKAERYLIASGVPYTIVHPGGLLDSAGGRRELVVGVDDQLLNTKFSTVPRADVAEVCLESLRTEEAKFRSFDLGSRPEGEGNPWDGNLKTLLMSLGGHNCQYNEPEWPEDN